MCGRSRRIVITLSTANGSFTARSSTTVLIIRPAAISRPHETASSTTTSAPLNRPIRPLVDPRESSLSTVPALTREACSAGSVPAASAGDQDQAGSEQRDAPVEVERHPERHGIDGHRVVEPTHADHAEPEADDAAEEREHEHLRQMLPDDLSAARANRDADGHFAPPQRRARREQVRHVDARDEEHADRGAEHRVQQAVHFRAQVLLDERLHVCADALVRLWKLLSETGRDRVDLNARLREGHAVLETRDHLVVRSLAAGRPVRIELQRQPQRLELGEAKSRRHDADHAVRHAVRPHHAVDNLRRGAESMAPHVVTQEDHRRRARLIIARFEPASEHGLDLERVECRDR